MGYRNIFGFALAVLMTACGAEQTEEFRIDGDPNEFVADMPEFAGFVDDEEKANYCLDNPDSSVCSELGTARQAWVSAIGHGATNDGFPCYSPSGSNQFCGFPHYKTYKLTLDQSVCGRHMQEGWVTGSQYGAILNGFIDGIKSLGGYGTGFSFSFDSGSMPTPVSCMTPPNSVLARAGLDGASENVVNNLPIANNGVDEGTALTFRGAVARFNPKRIKLSADACAYFNDFDLYRHAFNTGVHEGLHMVGFDHFTTGIMKATVQCLNTFATLPSGFDLAMTAFDNSGGGVTIINGSLNP